jgi:hypothetical protein
MNHTWANPDKEWEGFHLTSYSLDTSVLELQLAEQRKKDGKVEEVPITLGEILERVNKGIFKIKPLRFRETVITAGEESLTFAGSPFAQNMLHVLLSLRSEEVSPFNSEWFFYEHDSVKDDPHEMYNFFVVYDNRIVRERIGFSDHSSSGFDPSFFKARDDFDTIWLADAAWREAEIHFWFKKFYSETRTGQLMLLRNDEPRLYGHHYPQAGGGTVVENNDPISILSKIQQESLGRLGTIRGLLWILIFLVGLILARLLW